jgi:hypothetical protein
MDNQDEIKKAAETLNKLTPGFLPKDIFLQVTRLCVTPIIEVVPLRKKGHSAEVLLFRRPENDPIWPNKLHTPGTVMLASDEKGSLKSPFARIIEGEMKGVIVYKEPVFVEYTFHQVARGSELALVHLIEVVDNNGLGEFYNVESLPDTIVDTQIEFIQHAAKYFLKQSVSKA